MARFDMSNPDPQVLEAAERDFEPVDVYDSSAPDAEPIRMEPFMINAILGGQ